MTSKTNIPKPSGMEVGERHHRLTAVSFVRRNKRRSAIWKFQCECGNTHEVEATYVRIGNTKSCGCLKREARAANGRANATHGKAGSPIYKVWRRMITRCTNPNVDTFKNYGGRGISVCKLWRESFEAFYADMGDRPSKDHSIDRINNDGNYEPGNVQWSTRKEQARNKRKNRIVIVNGASMTLAEAVEKSGLKYNVVLMRLCSGWSVERALGTPVAARKWHTPPNKGQCENLAQDAINPAHGLSSETPRCQMTQS